MIATILPGSTNFHAVGYNERKVSKGVARLLEIQNFGALGTFGKPTSEELVRYLQEYSSRNSRIQKAQFHVAISCKGHEQSESELLEFAHQYLKEMGYGEAGQPLLVYSHHDTDNTHLHIVTSRIAPDGKKIAHDHERRRSQEVIDRILGTNRKQKTGKDINDAKQYTFSSFAQFKSVMTSMGYETYQKDGIVFIKHGGKVQQKLPLSEIEALYRNGYRDIEDFIDRLLTLNPKITQGEIYDKIRKQRAYIKKGVIYFDGQTRPLKPFMAEAIDRNNRIAWVEKFSPVSEAERDLLCQIFKVNRPDLVALSSEKPTSRMDAVLRLQEIFNEEADTSVRSRLYAEGFIIRENGGSTYAINFKRHILINLTEEGFDLDRLKRKSSKKQTNKVPVRNAARPHSHHVKLRDAGGGSQSEKREWEVGHKGNYDEIDDGRSLKR